MRKKRLSGKNIQYEISALRENIIRGKGTLEDIEEIFKKCEDSILHLKNRVQQETFFSTFDTLRAQVRDNLATKAQRSRRSKKSPVKKEMIPGIRDDRNYFDSEYKKKVAQFAPSRMKKGFFVSDFLERWEIGMRVLAKGTLHLLILNGALEEFSKGDPPAIPQLRRQFQGIISSHQTIFDPKDRMGELACKEGPLKYFFRTTKKDLGYLNISNELKWVYVKREMLPHPEISRNPIMICRACRDLLENVFDVVCDDLTNITEKTYQRVKKQGRTTGYSPWIKLYKRSSNLVSELRNMHVRPLINQYKKIEKELLEISESLKSSNTLPFLRQSDQILHRDPFFGDGRPR